jgi:hypothetical protein
MAGDKEKKTYPMLPIAHWWLLRKKFKQSIPGIVTEGYLTTVLQMKPISARANVLPFLKQLGIIDEDGKTAQRARLWRDDEHYPEVCKAMLSEVYPEELLQAVPDPNADRPAAERWFAHQTGAGAGAVGRMVALYAVLAEADASKQPEQDRAPRKPGEERQARPNRAAAAARAVVSANPSRSRSTEGPGAPSIAGNKHQFASPHLCRCSTRSDRSDLRQYGETYLPPWLIHP